MCYLHQNIQLRLLHIVPEYTFRHYYIGLQLVIGCNHCGNTLTNHLLDYIDQLLNHHLEGLSGVYCGKFSYWVFTLLEYFHEVKMDSSYVIRTIGFRRNWMWHVVYHFDYDFKNTIFKIIEVTALHPLTNSTQPTWPDFTQFSAKSTLQRSWWISCSYQYNLKSGSK